MNFIMRHKRGYSTKEDFNKRFKIFK